MNRETNIQLVGLAAGIATVTMWLLGYFAPELAAQAPMGLEAAITGIITVLAGYIAKPSATTGSSRESINRR